MINYGRHILKFKCISRVPTHHTYFTLRLFNFRSQQDTCSGPLPLRKPASAGSL